MYKRRSKRNLFVCICLLMMLMTGCATKGEALEDTIDVEGSVAICIPQINEKDYLSHENLLTGLNDLSDEAIGKRPVAVMVNNVNKALPQYGIAKADLIFEIVVEGNQTRLMALYGDYTDVPRIVSVRSCRKYFPAFSEGFDAIYVHWGMNSDVQKYINSLKLTRYDGMNNTGGLFGRDSSRKKAGYALEHTSYFDGTRLPNVLKSRGDRIELEADKKGPAFLFNGVFEEVVPNGDSCEEVSINFGSTKGKLIYDLESNTYLKEINGKKQIDASTGEQLSFTNVFVLETSITNDSNGYNKKVDWTGGKNSVGYYVSNGAVQKIHWEKAKGDVESYLKFYDENNQELSINRGKSYIAVNYKGKTTFN